MTTLHMESGVLLAEKVNVESREIPFTALRFGEVGRTNLGRMIVDKGAFALPEDVENTMAVNLDHEQVYPLGRVLHAEERDETIDGVLRIAKGKDGDALLARYAENDPDAPRAVSLEVRDIVLRAGRAVSGVITGLAITKAGAFPSASLFAADAGDIVDEEELAVEVADAAVTTEGDIHVDVVIENPAGEQDEEEEEDAVAEATASEVMLASRATPEKKEAGLFASRQAYFRALDDVMGGRASYETRQLVSRSMPGEAGLFALSDIDYDGTGGVGAKMTPTQWIGEVLDGTTYRQRYAPLFGSANLSQLAMAGWKWGVKPAGATWTGNKDAISSNTPTIVPVTENATRWAGGHDIAREHRDFGTPGFFEAYNAAMRESFDRWLDTTIVLTEALAGATDLEADNPSGLDIGAGWSAVIDGAASIVASGLTPTSAVVSPELWKAMAKIPNSDVLGYLNASLSLTGDGRLDTFQVVPAAPSQLTTGHVLVVAREAADVYTLPGSPIRAEALNIANGGIDVGFFGYGGFLIKNAAGIVDVAPYTP